MTRRDILHYSNLIGFLWTLCACMFTTDMPGWFQFGGLALFLVTWVIELFADKRWQTKPTREWVFFGLLIVFFLWGILYWPYDGQVYFVHHLNQRLPLLAFGIVGLFELNERYSRATVIHTMAILSVGSVLFMIAKLGWYDAFISPDRVYKAAEVRIQYINAHMGYNFFLNSTLIGLWYLLFHAERKPQLWQKILYPLVTVIILWALLSSDGRSGFFMGLAILGMMTVVELYRYRKWLGISFSIIALAGLLAVSTLHPRIDYNMVTHDLRYLYWKAAGELIEEKPLLGYGMSNAQEQFDQVNMKYVPDQDRVFWTVLHTHYVDCHNQYIQTTLEFGVVGLLLLMAIYLSPLFLCWGKREWGLAFFFTLISMGQSLFDMFLTGRFCTIYCLLMLLTIRITNDYPSRAPREA